MKRLWLFFILVIILLSACNLPQKDATTTPPPTNTTAPSTQVPPTNALPLPEHHIAIRIVNGVGEFYNRETGEKFIPRGMNYVRLAPQTKMDGSSTFGHSLFDPGQYNSLRVSGDLAKMHNDGYNVVRVFLSPDTMGTASGGFSSAYIKNIVEFLKIAETNQIYVMFTLDWIPGGKWGQILSAGCCDTFALMNANFLPPAGLKANQVFFQDFARELIKQGAPTEYIFSYQLRNEMFYDMDQPPLSFTTGKVTTANGKTYDMSSADEKVKMIEENNVFWLNAVRGAILEVDPTALVSVGFFHPQEPHPSRIGDPRYAVSAPAIWESQLDFIDLHAYPGFDLSLKQYMDNFGLKDMREKPVIMGEFGGEVTRFASVDAAAQRFVDWQIESCEYGFDGWLFWTWDTLEQPDFLNAKMERGKIEQALSPAARPDPCAGGANIGVNVAHGKLVSASNFLADQPPSNAVDNSPETIWSSGAGPSQWIQIDLGNPSTISAIRLLVAQYPEGDTVHQIWAGADTNSLTLIHEFKGFTKDSDVLDFKPPVPLVNIRYIRVITTQSSSWVAWREIEVIGE